jgi:hypothetical protein
MLLRSKDMLQLGVRSVDRPRSFKTQSTKFVQEIMWCLEPDFFVFPSHEF